MPSSPSSSAPATIARAAVYPAVEANPDFVAIERAELAHWKAGQTFQRSMAQRPANHGDRPNEFVFYDGPPFANGLPHYGHLLTGFVKDLFARYQTMQGRRVERRFGWDCHGLPAEMGAEKELGISGRNAIQAFGIEKFNAHCRTSVMTYTHDWERYVTRQARWVDFRGDYKTMDTDYMESVLWAFKQLYEKGLIYESFRVMPYSWAAETPLSNFETKLDNAYRERTDKSATVAFTLTEKPPGAPEAKYYKLLAWTTTPWTLPCNLALAVSRDIAYRAVTVGDTCYIAGPRARALQECLQQETKTYPHAVLVTARTYLRPLTAADQDAYAALVSDAEVMRYIYGGVQTPQQAAEGIAQFAKDIKAHGHGLMGVFARENGRLIGRAGIMQRVADPAQPEQAEMGYIYAREVWGQGYASEVAEALVRYVFALKNPEKLVVIMQPDNAPSRRVAEKIGAVYVKDIDFRGMPCQYTEVTRETFESRFLISGASLLGMRYEPLFPYLTEAAEAYPNAFTVLDGTEFVTDGDGTGIVHMAPAFGEVDSAVCAQNGIPIFTVPVDGQGRYTDEIYDLPASLPRALETERTRIRPLTEGDYPHFRALLTDAKVAATISDGILPEEKIRAEFERFLADQAAKGFSQWGVFLQSDGRFIGRAGFDNRDFDAFNESGVPAIELRYAFLGDYWGQGYASEVGQALLHWAAEYLPQDMVTAGCNDHYPPAHRVLQKLGFTARQLVDFRNQPVRFHTFDLKAYRAGKAPQARHGLTLRGLNVIAETQKHASEPYSDEQLARYGLANLRIVSWLKERGDLIAQDDYRHNYPHCWRTDTPLIYRAMPSWYVEVTKIKQRMVELNQQINWIPAHVRDGAMGHMLESAPDWSISRNRFWGTPIPIWRSDKPGSESLYVFGSIAELEAFFGTKVHDLHRPYIDELTKPDPDDADYTLRRVEDVFDCWFESGSMPFAQVHYPFENKEWFDTHFPADFITEYIAQTRGWFNTLITLSTALFDRPPFKNCICHGVVIDEETGLKYSKRLKNYKDPMLVMDQYGADALRWMMVSSPVMRGMDLAVDPEGKFIRDIVRLHIKPLWNAYNFFTLYANADGVKAKLIPASDNLLDRYILAKLRGAVETIRTSLDAYDSATACAAVSDFVDGLNNWYIRRNRERFWESSAEGIGPDKQAAYDTLYTVLVTLCRAAAPLLPLVTEAIHRGLTNEESVHLDDFPDVRDLPEDAELVADMDRVRDACTAMLSIRSSENIRVRQPLASATLYGSGAERLKRFADLIADEVNVKEIRFSDAIAEAASFKLQVHFPVLGKRLPAAMKQVIPASKSGQWEKRGQGIAIAGIELLPEEFTLQLEPKDKKGAQALSSNDALVVLDLTLAPALVAEGYARDVVRAVQQARKEADLAISEHILLILTTEAGMQAQLRPHLAFIGTQVLASEVSFGAAAESASRIELDGTPLSVSLRRAQA